MEGPDRLSADHVLFEDNHLLVLDKPPGVAVQGDGTREDLIFLAKAYLKEKYDRPGAVFCAPAHRLDTNASGIVVMARTSKAARRLFVQFKDHTVRKFYRTLVATALEPGTYTDLLAQDRKEQRARPDVSGKEARLEVLASRPLQFQGQMAYELEIELWTGRYHQIRCQLALRGCPILGDRRYGSAFHATRIYLHADRLVLLHPVRQESLYLTSPQPWGEASPFTA